MCSHLPEGCYTMFVDKMFVNGRMKCLLLLLLLGRLPKVDLIILEGGKCPSVRPYVRPQKGFDFNEIWYIGRGR